MLKTVLPIAEKGKLNLIAFDAPGCGKLEGSLVVL
jgi:hypothetical protein